jgi:hypothetical protein
MDFWKKNWIWLLLAIPAAFLGYEIVTYLWAAASRESPTCWFNKLKFWNQGTAGATGPVASGSNCSAHNEAASCVPASARTSIGVEMAQLPE